jgi:predicted nuclease with TOPRIM domain
MNEEYKDLIEKYNILYSKLAVTDYFIVDFKAQQNANTLKLEELKEKISALDSKVHTNFNNLGSNLNRRLYELESKVEALETKITPLSNNSFLQLTNSMDFKKWLAFISILVSILTGAGLLDDLLSPSFTGEQLNNKIEELIKLTN